MTEIYDAYISASQEEAEFADKLCKYLQGNGVKVLMDKSSVAVGDSLVETMEKVVEQARYMLVLMSPAYFDSPWVSQEWQIAMAYESEHEQLKVIPILYRDCDVPPLLKAKKAADFTGNRIEDSSLLELLEIFEEKDKLSSSTETDAEGSLGSIRSDAVESAELKDMIMSLQSQVDAFIQKTDDQPDAVSEERVQDELNQCFVVMPFSSEELNVVYEYFIKPSVQSSCGLLCERGDDMFGSNAIMDDIRRSIHNARLIIADLTDRNPNVFYEVGIAHALNKDVLLVSQSMDDVPFDFRHLRVLTYEYTPMGCKKLEMSIIENINAIMKRTEKEF